MLIPIWIIYLLAAISALIGISLVVMALILAVEWAVERVFAALRNIMSFYGMLASFTNYMRVIILAADGGEEWFNHFLAPREGEPQSDPSSYFRILPRPEAYRWWMRFLGVKRPKVEASK